jgi:hypothetical protein
MDKEALGRVACEAFGRSSRFNPDWCELDQAGKAHWIAAAEAVVEAAKGERPAPAAAPVQKPSIGRIVHYTVLWHTCGVDVCAALIVAVNQDGTVNLLVFDDVGDTVKRDHVEFTDAPAGSKDAVSKWTWPART